jgi:membrane-associated phospholipid phosphatase
MRKDIFWLRNSLKVSKFAKIVSYIFDGSYISIPAYFVLNLYMLHTYKEILLWSFLCILFGSLIPFMFIFILYKKKKINDLHVPKREERIKPILVTLVSYMLGFFVFYILKSPVYLRAIFFGSFLTVFVFILITYFWKISFHTSWITFFCITYFIIFGKWALFLILLIPLVAWARVKIKRHTIAQVICGSVVTAITAFFGYSFFGMFKIF